MIRLPLSTNGRARSASWAFCVLCAALAFVVQMGTARAQLADMPPQLAHVGVTEHLDSKLPLDGAWRDQGTTPITLGQLIDGKKPILFVFAYHSCPTLCSMVLKATGRAIHDMPWTVGKEFDVVVASIDPEDSLENLTRRRDLMIADYNRPGSEAGFHFLLGDKPTIERTLAAAGVEVQYDEQQKQWGHPAVIMLLKPNGELARYLYGLEYSPNDVRVGLLEASNGKSISTVEQVILYCYQFDPNGGRYVLVAWRVMRIGGALVAIALIGTLSYLWLRERKRAQLSNQASRDEADAHQDSTTAEPAHSHL